MKATKFKPGDIFQNEKQVEMLDFIGVHYIWVVNGYDDRGSTIKKYCTKETFMRNVMRGKIYKLSYKDVKINLK